MNDTEFLKATQSLIKRWRALEAAQRDLDFRKSEWSRDLRALWPAGTRGDDAFVAWCGAEVGLTPGQAGELLARAAAAIVVPDVATWNAVGGFRAIRPLAELTRKEQVAVLGAVKETGYSVRTVLKQRGHTPDPVTTTARPSHPHPPHRAPGAPTPADIAQAEADARELALYLAANGKSLPRAIMKIIAKYAAVSATRAARERDHARA